MTVQGGGGRFSALLLEGLDHYRKGRMLDAVRAWEEAYLLEPTNLRAREFLRSALERIHAVMSPGNKPAAAGAAAGVPHPWLPPQRPLAATPVAAPAPASAPASARKPAGVAPEPAKKAPPGAGAAKKPASGAKPAAATQKKPAAA